jgi:CheY-like chemotaxis protein
VYEVAEEPSKLELAGQVSHEHRTVLLVEDEPALRKLTRRMLVELGLNVLEADHAGHAIEIANRTETPIDLLLTDVVMPGMNGWALAELISAQRPETRVLYMSGYPDDVLAKHGVTVSSRSILRKPFTRAELTRWVEEVAVGVTGK